MKQLVILIKTHARSHAVDFQFPGEIPIQELIPLLVQINGWPQKDDQGKPLFYWLEYQTVILDDELTLLNAGIRNGMTVLVKSGNEKPEMIRKKKTPETQEPRQSPKTAQKNQMEPPDPAPFKIEFEPLDIPLNISVQDRRSHIAPPSEWKKIEAKDIHSKFGRK